MKNIKCLHCGNSGALLPTEDCMVFFSEDNFDEKFTTIKKMSAFRQRKHVGGKRIAICNNCDSGLWIGLFGKPKMIDKSDLDMLKSEWESGTQSKF